MNSRLSMTLGFLAILTGGFGNRCVAENPVQEKETMSITKQADGETFDVRIGDKLFTTFIPNRYAKPIFYPLNNSAGTAMTRSYPMVEKPADESDDHPHHKSLWFAHEINNVDFWHEKDCKIRSEKIEIADNTLTVNSNWIRGDDKIVCTDVTTYTFGQSNPSINGTKLKSPINWIDFKIEIVASEGDIEFKDTKEGTFAMRTHPDLRLTADPKNGVEKVFGHAINSEGLTDKAIWSKRARWVLYWGEVNGAEASVMMCDHPSNLRHPTTWHARDYGLVAANPFGIHDFEGKALGTGTHRVANGQRQSFRYRILLADGRITSEIAEALYDEF